MKKVYKYENSIVTVVIVENSHASTLQSIKKATENFLIQVIKERSTNGNGNTSRDISKK